MRLSGFGLLTILHRYFRFSRTVDFVLELLATTLMMNERTV